MSAETMGGRMKRCNLWQWVNAGMAAWMAVSVTIGAVAPADVARPWWYLAAALYVMILAAYGAWCLSK